ncbi:MAG: two-component sensor histidine kinase [Pirellulaceae bacterium]|nr:MAG: two-component sensor histidine kinase [Pirellulaceae bacterium]
MSATQLERLEELEKQLEQLKERLVQCERLAVLGELVSTTTHEFNNILMTIINYAKLGMRAADEPTRAKALDRILAASQRAARITATILGAARNRSESFEPTDLPGLVRDTLLLLEREMQKYRIQVECDLQPVPAVLAIGNQIQQVLINLLVNARQAMPDGGRLLVRVAPAHEPDMVQLVVRDTGTGIPAELLPKIFEPFFTTKRGPDRSGKGGTGLGLSYCRDVIEAHRGRIRVESTVGKGTAFTILLPVAPPAAFSQAAQAATAIGSSNAVVS